MKSRGCISVDNESQPQSQQAVIVSVALFVFWSIVSGLLGGLGAAIALAAAARSVA